MIKSAGRDSQNLQYAIEFYQNGKMFIQLPAKHVYVFKFYRCTTDFAHIAGYIASNWL